MLCWLEGKIWIGNGVKVEPFFGYLFTDSFFPLFYIYQFKTELNPTNLRRNAHYSILLILFLDLRMEKVQSFISLPLLSHILLFHLQSVHNFSLCSSHFIPSDQTQYRYRPERRKRLNQEYKKQTAKQVLSSQQPSTKHRNLFRVEITLISVRTNSSTISDSFFGHLTERGVLFGSWNLVNYLYM